MAISVDKVSSPGVRSVANKQVAGKVSAPNFKFKKSGEFKINGARINVRKGDNLENIVKKINKNSSSVKAELVKSKSGKQVIELKSKRSKIQIDDRKTGIVEDIYKAGQIKRVDKNSRIEYLEKTAIDYSNYLNNLLTGKVKASLATASSGNPPVSKADVDGDIFEDMEQLDDEEYYYNGAQAADEDGDIFAEMEQLDNEEYYYNGAQAQADAEAQALAEAQAQALADQAKANEITAAALAKAEYEKKQLELENQVAAQIAKRLAIKENRDESESIAKDAVSRVIIKHDFINTEESHKEYITKEITKAIHDKGIDNAELKNKAGKFAELLAKKIYDARGIFASWGGRLEITAPDLNQVIQWIKKL
jgi:hypothetical protein